MNTKNTSKEQAQNNSPYNEEPVYYCKSCLSLRILGISKDDDCNFCDDCGSVNIETINIKDWETLYKERYGKLYLNK